MRTMMWAALMVVTAASSALGQTDAHYDMHYLGQKSVQEDLKLTPDQIKKVEAIDAKYFESFREIRGLSLKEQFRKSQEINRKSREALYKLLTPEQRKRQHQIFLQIQGLPMLGYPLHAADARELGLTKEQKKNLFSLEREIKEKSRAIQPGDSRQEKEKKSKENEETRKRTDVKAFDLLTPEQKVKWKKMIGEPFKGDILFPGGRVRFNQDAGKKP